MDTSSLLALLVAASLNTVIPWRAMVLALGHSAARGFSAGVRVNLGRALATLVPLAQSHEPIRLRDPEHQHA